MNKVDTNIIDKIHDITINPHKYSASEQGNAFLLLKFYNNPTCILGSADNPTPEEYQNIANYDDLFLNNDFVSLVEYGLRDDKFMNKISIQILRKIGFFLYDSIECKEKYIPGVRDKYNEAQEVANASRNKSFEAFVSALADLATLDRALKYSKYSEELVNNFDTSTAARVRRRVADNISYLYELTEGRKREKQFILSLVASERYIEDHEDDIYLEMHSLNSGLECNNDYVTSLVLENKFIDIVDSLLADNGMSKLMIRNAIEILTLGIRIKKHELLSEDYHYLSLFSTEDIKEFNINKAQHTINNLSEKLRMRNNKLSLVKRN